MTPLQQPELLPGLKTGHPISFEAYRNSVSLMLRASHKMNKLDFAERLIFALFLLFIYLPAWLYRFILKSTMWFWWILFIVGGAPRLDGGIEGLRDDAYRQISAWTGIALTVFALVNFWLPPLIKNFIYHDKLPNAVALLVLVDWSSLPVVQWFTLASALTTVAVVLWTNGVYLDSQNPHRANRLPVPLPWLGQLVKWKSAFGAVSIALLMLYFALYANAIHHYVPVSDWAASWLRWLYGDAAGHLGPVVP
jgi:hypothetical protein